MYQSTEAERQRSEQHLLEADRYYNEFEQQLATGNHFAAQVALHNATHLTRRAYAIHQPITSDLGTHEPSIRG